MFAPQRLTSGLEAEIICVIERLEAIEPQWWSLFDRVPALPPFVSPAWLLPWWRAFHPGLIRAHAIWRGDRLAALAPLYREPTGALRMIGIAISDELDLLVDSTSVGAAEALASSIELDRWDRFELEELPEAGAAMRLRSLDGARSEERPGSPSPVLVIDGARDLRGLIPPRKHRNVRLARARGERAAVRIEELEALGEERFLDELFRLHQARWACRGETGVLAAAEVRGFHRQSLPRLHARGLVRGHCLVAGDEVLGIHYTLARSGRQFAYLSGFDPRHATLSPGTALLAHGLETAIAEGAREVGLLRGDEPYKYEWGATRRVTRCRTFTRS